MSVLAPPVETKRAPGSQNESVFSKYGDDDENSIQHPLVYFNDVRLSGRLRRNRRSNEPGGQVRGRESHRQNNRHRERAWSGVYPVIKRIARGPAWFSCA